MSTKRICVDCGNIIPLRIKINDIWKITSQNRLRCFDCKPFGKMGKTILEGRVSKRMCNYHSWPDEWKKEHQEKTKARGKSLKEKLVKLKGGRCVNCGYNKSIVALTFHHKNPSEKIHRLTAENILRIGFNKALIESDKCELLCMNCHAELHYNDN